MAGKIENMGKRVKMYLFLILMVFVAVAMGISMFEQSGKDDSSDPVKSKQAVDATEPNDLEESQRKIIMAHIMSQFSPQELAVLNGEPSEDRTALMAYNEMNVKAALEYIKEKTKGMNQKEYDEFMKTEFAVKESK